MAKGKAAEQLAQQGSKDRTIKLSALKPNPINPRMIREEKFFKLLESIKEFPQMMELRPIIIDEEGLILGGNMRFKALEQLGYIDIPINWVKRAEGLTEDQKSEFVIKDNNSFGEYDWDKLANEWSHLPLEAWGVDILKEVSAVDLEEFFGDQRRTDTEEKYKIVLSYGERECEEVKNKLREIATTPSDAVKKLLKI